jgi:hypothetical protein
MKHAKLSSWHVVLSILFAEALEEELLACFEGLALAIQHSQLLVTIDSDCRCLH